MFNRVQLEKVIELHNKSYNLFIWIKAKLHQFQKTKSRIHSLFSAIHADLRNYEACLAWVNQHYKEFPNDMRPDKNDIEAFSHLLSSILTTSFKDLGYSGHDACNCFWCTHTTSVEEFELKNPSKKDLEFAQKFKINYILGLLKEEKIENGPNDIASWITSNPDLSYDLALATYAFELIRRSKFQGQGTGNLALWREIAWNENGFNKRFKLKSESIIEAEKKILNQIKNATF